MDDDDDDDGLRNDETFFLRFILLENQVFPL